MRATRLDISNHQIASCQHHPVSIPLPHLPARSRPSLSLERCGACGRVVPTGSGTRAGGPKGVQGRRDTGDDRGDAMGHHILAVAVGYDKSVFCEQGSSVVGERFLVLVPRWLPSTQAERPVGYEQVPGGDQITLRARPERRDGPRRFMAKITSNEPGSSASSCKDAVRRRTRPAATSAALRVVAAIIFAERSRPVTVPLVKRSATSPSAIPCPHPTLGRLPAHGDPAQAAGSLPSTRTGVRSAPPSP